MPRPRGKNVEYDTYMDASQRAKYRLIEERARALREARVSGWEEVQRAFQEQLRHYQFSLENAVLEAWEPVEKGATPKVGLRLSTIGRAMGTQDYGTVRRIVDKWSPELHSPRSTPEYTMHSKPAKDGQFHPFTLHHTEFDGLEYVGDTSFALLWIDGMWDIRLPDDRGESALAAVLLDPTTPFQTVEDWRVGLARRVGEAGA